MFRKGLKPRGRVLAFTFSEDPEKPILLDTISRYLSEMCKKCNIAHITPHMIGRTPPTIPVTKYNVDPKTLRPILGYSDISTTLGYRTMVDDKRRRKALELHGDAIGNGDRKDDDDPEDSAESVNSKIEIKQIAGSSRRSCRRSPPADPSCACQAFLPYIANIVSHFQHRGRSDDDLR